MAASIAMTTELSRRVAAAIAALTPQPIGHVDFEGVRYQALPLFGTLGEVWLLRPDGSLWRADSDSGLALEPLPAEWQIVALVAGRQRYPWLVELLPARPAAAVDCAECGGSGRLGVHGAGFCLACRALGWRVTPPP